MNGRSDLGVRSASALVMVTLAGIAVWAGGPVWVAFVCAVAVGVLWEWIRLARAIVAGPGARAAWNFAGMLYVGVGAAMLLFLHNPAFTLVPLGTVLATVIAVDVGAYFTGRTLRGPKIAPSISPSKTWSGLLGGVLGATLTLFGAGRLWQEGALSLHPDGLAADRLACLGSRPCSYLTVDASQLFVLCLAIGVAAAVCAQAGDFFQSWMKRRAGVKDSGDLIPGHGGLFDRVDGLLAVLFALSVMIVYHAR